MIRIRLGVVSFRLLVLLMMSAVLFTACAGLDGTPTLEYNLPVTPTPEYNLPPATLTYSTCLYASPNRSECIVPAPIPAGETVDVMGRNVAGSHLRVVFGTGVGWVPVSFTDYNDRPEMLKALPIFTRQEPPACAEPITTQFGLNSTWTSDKEQRIAVVVDLFRSRYGDFPSSFLSLTVNGKEVESTRRQIVERGQFLLGVVFPLSGYVQPGDTMGYLLDTMSDEPLTFMATIFSLPENCYWGPLFSAPLFPSTGVKFYIEHLREQLGEQITETVSYVDEPGLDNSSGTAPLQVQIQFERNYRHQIIIRLNTSKPSSQRVQDKIVELYKLPPNGPEGTI